MYFRMSTVAVAKVSHSKSHVCKKGPLFVAELYRLPGQGPQPPLQPEGAQAFGIVRLPTGQGKCLACGKVFSNIHNCRTHFREVHYGDQGPIL
jgi:hypothetical protein